VHGESCLINKLDTATETWFALTKIVCSEFLFQVASSRGSADMLLLLLNYGPTMLAAKGHISVLGKS
jgi:CRISPR/Cas system-associated endonuclease Cas1